MDFAGLEVFRVRWMKIITKAGMALLSSEIAKRPQLDVESREGSRGCFQAVFPGIRPSLVMRFNCEIAWRMLTNSDWAKCENRKSAGPVQSKSRAILSVVGAHWTPKIHAELAASLLAMPRKRGARSSRPWKKHGPRAHPCSCSETPLRVLKLSTPQLLDWGHFFSTLGVSCDK